MALVQNTLIGKASGSVGNVTFAGWKGLQVMKSKSTNNYSDPTQTQLNNNSKFAVITAFARSILLYITAGFKAGAVGKSEYNVFTQENRYSQVVTGTPGNYIVDTEAIIVSKGPEFPEGIANASKTSNTSNSITVAWDDVEFTRQDDVVYGLLFERATGTFIQGVQQVVSEKDFTFTGTGIGTNMANYDIHIFYVNSTNGKACDSRLI
jgi:hypothetical protein